MIRKGDLPIDFKKGYRGIKGSIRERLEPKTEVQKPISISATEKQKEDNMISMKIRKGLLPANYLEIKRKEAKAKRGKALTQASRKSARIRPVVLDEIRTKGQSKIEQSRLERTRKQTGVLLSDREDQIAQDLRASTHNATQFQPTVRMTSADRFANSRGATNDELASGSGLRSHRDTATSRDNGVGGGLEPEPFKRKEPEPETLEERLLRRQLINL